MRKREITKEYVYINVSMCSQFCRYFVTLRIIIFIVSNKVWMVYRLVYTLELKVEERSEDGDGGNSAAASPTERYTHTYFFSYSFFLSENLIEIL